MQLYISGFILTVPVQNTLLHHDRKSTKSSTVMGQEVCDALIERWIESTSQRLDVTFAVIHDHEDRHLACQRQQSQEPPSYPPSHVRTNLSSVPIEPFHPTPPASLHNLRKRKRSMNNDDTRRCYDNHLDESAWVKVVNIVREATHLCENDSRLRVESIQTQAIDRAFLPLHMSQSLAKKADLALAFSCDEEVVGSFIK